MVVNHEPDRRQDGSLPPAATLALLTTWEALISRARTREEIARQDRALGDRSAEDRNMAVAASYFARARAGES